MGTLEIQYVRLVHFGQCGGHCCYSCPVDPSMSLGSIELHCFGHQTTRVRGLSLSCDHGSYQLLAQ